MRPKVHERFAPTKGHDSTVRQKFERDKARIRELGFDIETVANDDGSVGYKIDPSSGYAPPIYFSADEERVVQARTAVLWLRQVRGLQRL